MCNTWKYHALLLFIVFVEKYDSYTQYDQQWTWDCVNEKCKRYHITEIKILQSLETCQMLCGPDNIIWPKPTGKTQLSKAAIRITSKDVTLQIASTPSLTVSRYVSEAFVVFTNYVKKLEKTSSPYNTENFPLIVDVSVDENGSKDPSLFLSTDESYTLILKVKNNNIHGAIKAKSFCGVHNAFETLSQLIWYDSFEKSLLILNFAFVKDSPVFPYRGFMLDTARNFFPVQDILRTIDGMAANKLNTFHWHVSDSNSFPLQLKSEPYLSEFGSYNREKVYTVENVTNIVNYAKIRGIRVLIEVDTPAHVGKAWSWGEKVGLGDIALKVEAIPWEQYCGQPPCGQLDPRNFNVYTVLTNVYREIIEMTGVTDIFHLGGDEVNENSWIDIYNDTDYMNLWLDFTESALISLKEANNGTLPMLTIIWSSMMTTDPYYQHLNISSLAVQLWSGTDTKEAKDVYAADNWIIFSNIDRWYLDCGLGAWRDDSEGHCPRYNSWSQMYLHRPWTYKEQIKVVGGETCMWSEMVGPGGLDARIWPRAAAVAERLWSDPTEVSPDIFVKLDMHRSRMLVRGIQASPIWPEWCSQNPNDCHPSYFTEETDDDSNE